MAKLLDVSTSGYYGWFSRPESEREQERLLLARGQPWPVWEPEDRMRRQGLRSKVRRKFVVTTDTKHDLKASPNLLNRAFDAGRPNGVGQRYHVFVQSIGMAVSDGTPFPELLSNRGIIPGIKVDTGAKDLAGFPGEKITEGLDGLRDRLSEYRHLGARFAKWRAVITIGDGIPTRFCVDAHAHALARYTALSQEAGLVPIVEPEVLMDGDHDIERCKKATEATLMQVFSELHAHRVTLEGILLKPNMVLSGKASPVQAGVSEVAETTVRSFRRFVPSAVPGIVFLSGGQSPEQATEHLNAMNALGDHPWELSFSYGRALQERTLKVWAGKADNVPAAQKSFHHRAKCNSAARYGTYSKQMEDERS